MDIDYNQLIKNVDIQDERFKKIEKQLTKMEDRAKEFCQSRSNFQIEKFIACDEYTPITKFRHVAHNSFVAMQECRRMIVDLERKRRRIENLQEAIKKQILVEDVEKGGTTLEAFGIQTTPNGKINPHFKDYDLEIYDLSTQVVDTEIRLKGLFKEIDYMEAICNKLESDEIAKTGSGFNAEKYQLREKEYWNVRLASQMHRSQIANQLGIGEGNYMSYLMSVEDPILPNSTNQIAPINIANANDLAVAALKDRPGVNKLMLRQLSAEE